jgi:branched-chain amino acid transport system permease protein
MRRTIAIVAAIVIGLLPFVLPAYQLTLMNFIGLASLVAIGLVLITGIAGLTSFGQAAFVGMGAYATAWATLSLGLSPWLSIFVSLLVAGVAALVIGLLTLRLSGHYLPLSTIAWSLSLFFLVGNIPTLGGHNGLPDIPGLHLFGERLTGAGYTLLIWLFVGLAFVSVATLLDSRTGRAVRCLRGRGIMLEAFGVNTARLKVAIFIHAALLAAISGWLYAHLLQFIAPTPFGLNASIEYLFMAVIGGVSNLWGAILGSAILIAIRDGLQDLIPGLLGSGGAAESIVFGIVMVLILQRASGGLMPFLSRLVPETRRTPPPDDATPLGRRSMPAAGTPLLSVDAATRRFGGLVAVNGVSFDLAAGEILGVIGPNGAGKSTLFNLLTGVLPVSEGEIRFAGETISGSSSRHIAGLGVARSFQHPMLRTTMTAIENVAVGAHLRGRKGMLQSILRLDRGEERAILAEARRQMERVGLGAELFAPAGNLSLGQQRLMEIARALAADPLLLLLDEPAAGLRYHEKQKLAAVLAQLRAEGVTILLVEHDMEFVMNLVDRLVVMNFGQKIAEGTAAEVQSNIEVQEAYLGAAA